MTIAVKVCGKYWTWCCSQAWTKIKKQLIVFFTKLIVFRCNILRKENHSLSRTIVLYGICQFRENVLGFLKIPTWSSGYAKCSFGERATQFSLEVRKCFAQCRQNFLLNIFFQIFSPILFFWTSRMLFWQPWRKVLALSGKKIYILKILSKIFLFPHCSPGHVECSFDNPAETFSSLWMSAFFGADGSFFRESSLLWKPENRVNFGQDDQSSHIIGSLWHTGL